MPTPSNEQLLAKYQSLPNDLQEAILSVDTATIIHEVGTKHKLMIDKVGGLADETGLVMLGFTHPKDYITNLSERLKVDREIAKEIAEEINSQVFFPIREHLKKIHGLMGESESSIPIPKIKKPIIPEVPSELSREPVFVAEKVVLETTKPKVPPSPIPPAPPILPIPATKSDFVASPKPPENLPVSPSQSGPVSPEPKPFETLTSQKVEIPVPPKANIEIDPYRESTASST